MIIGTAGHIDHGKTTLVKALTGVDTDRLPEERRRGVSIELGYAFMSVPGLSRRIGFIDVPGHERLVHTMLSGATGMDHALLLVAADDGVMPQTREHLAILSLLGITRGTVVITKADRVESGQVDGLRRELHLLLRDSTLEGAPVMAVSAQTGAGLDALRQHLHDEALRPRAPAQANHGFRMAVDRSFVIQGVGTVVTGTVHAGRVAIGDELAVVPGHRASTLRVRVRSLHAQNESADACEAGVRCALGVAGADKAEVPRGAWLCDPEVALSTDRLDTFLQLWKEETRTLRSGTPVHVHIGSEDVTGTVAVLDRDGVNPGESALVQLVLHRSIGAWHGDRVVVRDASASRTLGGGPVLDPMAPARYRRTAQRLGLLRGLMASRPEQRLSSAVKSAGLGLLVKPFLSAQGWRELPTASDEWMQMGESEHAVLLSHENALALREKVMETVRAFHERAPDELGPEASRLRRLSAPRVSDGAWRVLLAQWIRDGLMCQRGAFVHLPAHGVSLSQTEERLSQKAQPFLDAAGYEGAWVRDLARNTGESEPLMRVTLARLAQQGRLHQVVKDLYYPDTTMQGLIRLSHQVGISAQGELTAARFRDATGLGRKRAIQILEYLDRVGVLRRVGDLHRLRSDSLLLHKEPT